MPAHFPAPKPSIKRPRCLWCGRVIRSRLPAPNKVVILTVRLHKRSPQRKAYHQHLAILHADCALQAAHELLAVPAIRYNISRYDPLLQYWSIQPSRS